MKSKSYFKYMLKDGILVNDSLESLSAENIVGMDEYLKSHKKKVKLSMRLLLISMCIFIAMTVVRTILIYSEQDNAVIHYAHLFSCLLMLISLFLFNRNSPLGNSYIYHSQYHSLSNDKKEEIENYKKTLNRTKNIDSILKN